jgi:hypothetical protein
MLKEDLLKLFKKQNWEKEIDIFYPGSRIDIIWIMSDFVKEKKYIPEALEIAKIYVNDLDPTVENEVNQHLLELSLIHI